MRSIHQLTEEGEEGPVEQRRLNAANVSRPILRAKIDLTELGRLHIAAQLRGGLGLAVGALAEPKTGLSAQADPVGVPVVDSCSHEGSHAVLGVSVQLESTGERWGNRTRPNLNGLID